MDAYIFRAALYCGRCMVEELQDNGSASPAASDMEPDVVLDQVINAAGYASESEYDSDDFPKGPYANGGGEADSPQHCAICNKFLENPLTSDGYDYVREAIELDTEMGHSDSVALTIWKDFYIEG